MDSFDFNTAIHTAANRNGWDNCKEDEDGRGCWLSSTAHEGLLHVFPEDNFFCIAPTWQPIQKVTKDQLPAALTRLSKTDTAPKGNPPLHTERQSIVSTRTVQHRYRTGLEKLWHGKCACTSLAIPELLRASHAKPWKDCTPAERVDPYNGFLLEARYDALFDQGFISFSDDGTLLISPYLSTTDIRILDIPPNFRLPLSPRHLPYLHWHRQHIFRSTQP